MLHDKYHRSNHHSLSTESETYIDAGLDTIASPEQPFQGDFVINGAIVSTQSTNTQSAAFIQSVSCGVVLSAGNYSIESYGPGKFDNDISVGFLELTNTTLKVPLEGVSVTDKVLFIDNKGSRKCLRLWDLSTPVAELKLPPRFTLQPNISHLKFQENGSLVESASLSCQAYGYGEISYQWYGNGALLTGENNKTLTINTTGIYFVQAKSTDITTSESHTINSVRVVYYDKPSAHDDYVTALPYDVTIINALENDISYTGASVYEYTQPGYGIVNFDESTNQFLYTPSLKYRGKDSFRYYIKDSLERISCATVFLSCVIEPCKAIDDNISVNLRTPTTFSIGINDIKGTLQHSIIYNTSPMYGSLTLNKTTQLATYYPTDRFKTTDKFYYIISDSSGNASTATVVLSAEYIPLISNNDIVTVDFIKSTQFNIFDNDKAGSFTFTLVSFTSTSKGNLTLNSTTGDCEYKPSISFTGIDKFEYTLTNETGDKVTSTVTLTSQPPLNWQYGALTDQGLYPIGWQNLQCENLTTTWSTVTCLSTTDTFY